jgi:hypothetical protein
MKNWVLEIVENGVCKIIYREKFVNVDAFSLFPNSQQNNESRGGRKF